MQRRRRLLRALLSTALILFGLEVNAATAGFKTTVTRTVSHLDKYGNCMAAVGQPLSDFGLDCPGRWVTFSCSGDFAAKDLAKQNFETAQIAFLTSARVYVEVDDTKKHNGYCLARRVDLF